MPNLCLSTDSKDVCHFLASSAVGLSIRELTNSVSVRLLELHPKTPLNSSKVNSGHLFENSGSVTEGTVTYAVSKAQYVGNESINKCIITS